MGSWAVGLLLIVAGVLWLAFRATVGKKALDGSWWSHLIREVAVLDRIPIVGGVWKLLPLLLVAGGVLWLMGYRPPGVAVPAVERGTLCGDADHRPADVAEGPWESYECRSQAEAGDGWAQCLARGVYTNQPRRGCPGKQRCCPGTSN